MFWCCYVHLCEIFGFTRRVGLFRSVFPNPFFFSTKEPLNFFVSRIHRTCENVHSPENKEAIVSPRRLRQAFPIAGQNLPQYFKEHLEFFVVFKHLYVSFTRFIAESLTRYCAELWLVNTDIE